MMQKNKALYVFFIIQSSFLFASVQNQFPPIPDFIKQAFWDCKKQQNVEKILLFLEENPNNVEATDPADKKTILMFAARWGTQKVVRTVLDKKPNLNRQNNFGCTALMSATIYNSAGAVRLIAREGANLLLKDKEEDTALSITEKNKFLGKRKKRAVTKQKNAYLKQETALQLNTKQTKDAYENGTITLHPEALPEIDSIALSFLGDTDKEAAERAQKRRKIKLEPVAIKVLPTV